ncbi:MAG: metalloregulator ArsR/SmtB family transcription factor [Thermoplasmata archaeon]
MDTFAVLAEPRRRRVVEILAHRGKLSASQICDEFDVTPQAISQHLRVLREANVIQMERRAQRRLYTFNPKSLNQIRGWAAEMASTWNSRLARLDKSLKEEAV